MDKWNVYRARGKQFRKEIAILRLVRKVREALINLKHLFMYHSIEWEIHDGRKHKRRARPSMLRQVHQTLSSVDPHVHSLITSVKNEKTTPVQVPVQVQHAQPVSISHHSQVGTIHQHISPVVIPSGHIAQSPVYHVDDLEEKVGTSRIVHEAPVLHKKPSGILRVSKIQYKETEPSTSSAPHTSILTKETPLSKAVNKSVVQTKKVNYIKSYSQRYASPQRAKVLQRIKEVHSD